MSTADAFLPEQGLTPGDEPPTEAELEGERADRPDPEGDGAADRGEPPATATTYQAPDGESVDPADL